MNKIFAYILFATFFVFACNSFADAELSQYATGSPILANASDLCEEIPEMLTNKTLKNMLIGSYPENVDKSFYVDIDNDGKNEEFRYFTSRTYAYIAEVVNGKQISLPGPQIGSAYYSGNGIINYHGQFLLLHFEDSLLEIQKLIEVKPEERTSQTQYAHGRYKVQTICKYYD